MGNEGSVPQAEGGAGSSSSSSFIDSNQNSVIGDDAETLEYQARAPPSSTNPSPPGVGDPKDQVVVGIGERGGSTRPGRNMMGAVFTRRGHNHAHNHGERTGIERKLPPTQSAASTPPRHFHHAHVSPEDFDIPATDRKGHPTRTSAAQAVVAASAGAGADAVPGDDLAYMNTQDDNTYSQKQQHYPQHHYHGNGTGNGEPPPPQQPLYMQQQQMAAGAGGTHQHVLPNQQYFTEHRDQHVLQNPQHGSDSARQNMIGGGNSNNNGNGKKGSWRQAKGIMGSMKNLSLGSSLRSAISASPARNSNSARQNQQQQQQQTPHHNTFNSTKQVNNWELQWDADDDDEEEEEEEGEEEVVPAGIQPPPSQSRGASAQAGFVPQEHGLPPRPAGPSHPMTRPPDLDSGFAISHQPLAGYHRYDNQQQPITPALSNVIPSTQMGGHHGFVSPPSHDGHTAGAVPQHSKAHLVTPATPDTHYQTPGGGPAVVRYNDNDDGVEWDTGAAEQEGAETLHEKPNVEQFLPLLRVLGKGSFGKVVLVQKREGTDTGSLFAMKILKKSHLVRRRQIERTRTERKVLSVVNHPFIMKLHYAFQSPDKLYLVLDYCPGGELFFHLSRFRRFPERVARFYSAELLLALGHLHKRGIIYRDLKPENVLLDAEGHVKLGDFGLAKAGIRHAYEGATSMCGTPEYMAPEVLAQQGHGFCVDYWGLGMLTYEMMTGLPPWYTTDRAKLFRRLRSAPLDIPTYFSSSSASFTSALLERNPRRRLGVTGIRAAMEHEYFKSISWRALYGRKVEAPIRPCEGWSPPDPSSNDDNPAGPFKNSAASFLASSNGANNLNPTDLDAATANFDNQFTRMPVESDGHDYADGEEDLEELHEDTFVGFTFDQTDRDEGETEFQQPQQQNARQRTQHYPNQHDEGHSVD